MSMQRPRRPKDRTRTFGDRFGYRPYPEKRPHELAHLHNEGQTEKQRVLDKIRYDQMERSWRLQRIEQGREGWHGFGNKELPIESHRQDIMKTVATNRISLLAGETGSGKSTQLAQYALEMGYDRIVYLQPRRVTTDSISERIELELAEQFKERSIEMPEHLVGMAHSERATLHDDSVIQVMTSGVFKKRAPQLRDEWQDERVLIVADEVHEGNIETEFAIATAAELMTDRESWNMVLMSATLNKEEIQEAYQAINGKPIPSVTVEGRPYAIEAHDRPGKSVVDVFAEDCFEDGNKTMIFTDGKRSVRAIIDELEARFGDTIKALPLHSKIDEETRREIFYNEDQPGIHTVIVSTSAGQSGLTIAGLDRVISDGWTKSPELDEENASGLPRRLCSRAEIIQQMGRGGRDVGNAKFFLAAPVEGRSRRGNQLGEFVAAEAPARVDHIPADIYHTVITRNVLSAAAMDRDFYNLNEYLIHKVTIETIKEAYAVLKLMGAVDNANFVTDVGRKMDQYPLRPELAKAFVEVLENGTNRQKHQVAAIAASIEAGGLSGEKLELRNERLSSETNDDFIAELDMFFGAINYLEKHDDEESVYGLAAAGIDVANAIRAYKQYHKICGRAGIDTDLESLDNTFSGNDRTELQHYFLTGMPHLIYEEVQRRPNRGRRKINKNGEKEQGFPYVWFRNILGPPKGEQYGFDRQVGKRSVMAALNLPKDGFIAGYPRWFENDDGDTVNIIDKGFQTTPTAIRRALGRQALEVRDSVTIDASGRLQLVSSNYIGRFRTAQSKEHDRANSNDKIQRLASAALESPGPAQRELRQLKRYLDNLSLRVPRAQKQYYFNKMPLTDNDLVGIVTVAAIGAGSMGELDAHIRAQGLSLDQFITQDKIQAIEDNMPLEIKIGESQYPIHYISSEDSDAQPTIYEFPLSESAQLPPKIMIADGRNILFRYHYGEDEIRLLSVEQVKEMAKV